MTMNRGDGGLEDSGYGRRPGCVVNPAADRGVTAWTRKSSSCPERKRRKIELVAELRPSVSSATTALSMQERIDGFFQSSPDEMRYVAKISVWCRWLLWTAGTVNALIGPGRAFDEYAPLLALHLLLAAANTMFLIRLLSGNPITWRWLLATSAVDAGVVIAATALASDLQQFVFLALYPALAMFAVVFSSLTLCLVWTSIVAAGYAVTSAMVVNGPGLDAPSAQDLTARIVIMFAVVIMVNLVAGYERTGRRRAIERERALQRERIELSQRIHDTSAQSAYMIGLGIDNAMALASDENADLKRTLSATSDLSRAAMWELRQPIDMGLIYDGQTLSDVLSAHARTFTTITSVPAELSQSGTEPVLQTEARAGILAIAHNALTNAHRHADASEVKIQLDFTNGYIRLSVVDDGIGLPPDFGDRGHGFRNMQAEADRLGGAFVVESGGPGEGTSVTCRIPFAPIGTGA